MLQALPKPTRSFSSTKGNDDVQTPRLHVWGLFVCYVYAEWCKIGTRVQETHDIQVCPLTLIIRLRSHPKRASTVKSASINAPQRSNRKLADRCRRVGLGFVRVTQEVRPTAVRLGHTLHASSYYAIRAFIPVHRSSKWVNTSPCRDAIRILYSGS